MKLVRLVIVTIDLDSLFDREIIVELPISVLRCIPTTVEGHKSTLMVIAEIDMEAGEIEIEDGLIKVPESQRKEIESHLEFFAGCLSAGFQAKTQVISTQPEVGFIAESDEERNLLDNAEGIQQGDRGSVWMRNPISLEKLPFNELVDRPIGINLWSQSQNSGNAVNEYRDLLLLFENAFATPVGPNLAPLLKSFLEPTPFQYSDDEVDSWIEKRHASMHADLRSRDYVAGEKDVRSDLHRVRQAALDVLFNKQAWHDQSIERRNIWLPDFYSTSGKEFSVVRSNVDVVGTPTDRFNSFSACALHINVEEYGIWVGTQEQGTKLVSGPRMFVRS